MLCRPSLFPRDLSRRKPPVIDLGHVIEEAAWKSLRVPSCCGCRTHPCKRKGLYLQIDWNYLDRTDEVESFELVPSEASLRPVQLYRTQFKNFSGGPQNFTFRTERQTTSSMELTVQEGISVMGKFDLSFSLPSPSAPGGGGAGDSFKLTSALLGGQVQWNKSVTDKFTKTETLKWGVDSAVNLQDGQRALATLEVVEAKLIGMLRLRTHAHISHETSLLPVDVLTKNGDEVIATVDLAANSICKASGGDIELSADKKSFTYVTTVMVKAVYGVEQVASVHLLAPGEEESTTLDAIASYAHTADHQRHIYDKTGLTIKEIDTSFVESNSRQLLAM